MTSQTRTSSWQSQAANSQHLIQFPPFHAPKMEGINNIIKKIENRGYKDIIDTANSVSCDKQ
jgi:hypothetical protein